MSCITKSVSGLISGGHELKFVHRERVNYMRKHLTVIRHYSCSVCKNPVSIFLLDGSLQIIGVPKHTTCDEAVMNRALR